MNEKEISKMLDKNWYYQGFNATPGFSYGPVYSMFFDMYDVLGFGYTSVICFFEKDVCYYLYDYDDLEHIKNELVERYSKDPSYLEWLLLTDAQICQRVITDMKSLGSIKIDSYTNQGLYDAWRDTNKLYAKLLSISHIVEGFTLTTEGAIRAGIHKEYPQDQNALSILTTPPKQSFLTKEQYELACIAKELLARGEIACSINILEKYYDVYTRLQRHVEQYYWKLNNYTGSHTLSKGDFISEISDLMKDSNTMDVLIHAVETHADRLAQRQEYLNNIQDNTLKKLLEINNVLFEIHDRRKEYMTKSITYLDMFFREIAKRHHMSVSDLRYILPNEFEQLPNLSDDLHTRRKASIYFATKEEHIVFSGNDAKQYIDILTPKNEQDINNNVLTGNCASVGTAQGIVKVCRGIEEIRKVKKR